MKKLFSILSAAVIVLSVAAVMAFAVGDGKNRGDVNGDGKVDSADAMLVMKCDAGLLSLSNDEIKRADLNGDGKIDSCDAVYILRIAAGLKVSDAETTAKETSSVSRADNRRNNEADNGKYHEADNRKYYEAHGACNRAHPAGYKTL